MDGCLNLKNTFSFLASSGISNSNTFKEWIGIELNAKNKLQLWIPKGFAHGFLTLSESAEVQYKTTENWFKEYEKTIIWDDPDINIKWPLMKINKKYPIVSEKDSKADRFKKLDISF